MAAKLRSTNPVSAQIAEVVMRRVNRVYENVNQSQEWRKENFTRMPEQIADVVAEALSSLIPDAPFSPKKNRQMQMLLVLLHSVIQYVQQKHLLLREEIISQVIQAEKIQKLEEEYHKTLQISINSVLQANKEREEQFSQSLEKEFIAKPEEKFKEPEKKPEEKSEPKLEEKSEEKFDEESLSQSHAENKVEEEPANNSAALVLFDPAQAQSENNKESKGAPPQANAKELAPPPGKTYYDVLGLDPNNNPSQVDIKKAYYKQSRKVHPDKNPSEKAVEEFQLVGAAYNILGNPDKRKEYDSALPSMQNSDAGTSVFIMLGVMISFRLFC